MVLNCQPCLSVNGVEGEIVEWAGLISERAVFSQLGQSLDLPSHHGRFPHGTISNDEHLVSKSHPLVKEGAERGEIVGDWSDWHIEVCFFFWWMRFGPMREHGVEVEEREAVEQQGWFGTFIGISISSSIIAAIVLPQHPRSTHSVTATISRTSCVLAQFCTNRNGEEASRKRHKCAKQQCVRVHPAITRGQYNRHCPKPAAKYPSRLPATPPCNPVLPLRVAHYLARRDIYNISFRFTFFCFCFKRWGYA